MARLEFTPNLARQVACPTDANLTASSVAELLEKYFSKHPAVRNYVLDDQGAVRKHVSILVDGLNIRDRTHLSDGVTSQSEVFVFQTLSGG